MSEAQPTRVLGLAAERLASVIVVLGVIAAVALIGMLSVAGWTVASIGQELQEIELPAAPEQPVEKYPGVVNVDL